MSRHSSEKIQTNYKVLKSIDDKSLVDVELVTGKTHQIRAHLAHIGHFLIGDEKIIANVSANSQIKSDTSCQLAIDTEKIHIFDKISEKLICD